MNYAVLAIGGLAGLIVASHLDLSSLVSVFSILVLLSGLAGVFHKH